jgi:RimJ/RimL family protein N-acetyltransferase
VKPILTQRLVLRNWEERDRELFHRINSDDRVMEFFPFRRNRAQSDELMDRLRDEVDMHGFGFSAVEIAATGECIGFTGLHAAEIEPVVAPGSVEIGWRLAPEYWGKGYVTEAANAMLAFGFETHGLAEIISFAVWNNHRSTAVMERIGMTRVAGGDFYHPGVPLSHPELVPHVLYRLSRADWQRRG